MSCLQMTMGAGGDGASSDSGSSAVQQGDAAPGAAIEHVVAAQETAQALEGLDHAEVRVRALHLAPRPYGACTLGQR